MKPSQQTSVYLHRIRRTDRSDVAAFTLSAICNSGQSRMPEPTLNVTPTVQDHQGRFPHVRRHGRGLDAQRRRSMRCHSAPLPVFPIDGCEITGKTLRAARARLRCRHRATTVAMGRGVGLLSAHVEWEAGRRRLVELEFSVS